MPQFTVKSFLSKTDSLKRVASPPAHSVDIYTAFRMGKFLQAATEELTRIQKLTDSLYEKYGDKVEGGGRKIRDAEVDKFQAELDELMEGEVILPNIEPPIPIAKFEKAGLSPLDLVNLDFMLAGSPEPTDKPQGV